MNKIIDLCKQLNIELPENLAYLEEKNYNLITCSVTYTNKGDIYFARYPSAEERLCKEAYRKGAVALFTRKSYTDDNGNSLPCILVNNPLRSYIELCASLKSSYPGKTVAITGSLGKTTTKDMLKIILSKNYKTYASVLNRNGLNSIGTGVQKISSDIEYYVQEVGAALPKLIEKGAEILQPDVTIITNISYIHLDKYKDIDAVLYDKLALARRMPKDGVLILNADDKKLMEIEDCHKKITFGVKNTDADYFATNITSKNDHICFDIINNGETTPVTLHSLGVHNVINATAAFAAAHYLGMKKEDIISGLLDYYGYGIRQNYTNIGGYNMYIDCYNNAPDSLVGAVRITEKIPLEEGKKRIAIIGDLRHLDSSDSEMHHIKVGEAIGNSALDIVLCFGKYNNVTMQAIKQHELEVYHTNSRAQLNSMINEFSNKGDLLLFKGPYPLFIAKSIDDVFGTSFHFYEGGKRRREVLENYTVRFITEHKELIDENPEIDAAISNYRGTLKKLSIPEYFEGVSVKAILKEAFKGKKIKYVSIPNSVYNIGSGAFLGCSALKDVLLPDGLKIIEDSAFAGCKKLKSVTLPEGVTDIYNEAFSDCTGLKKIYIPESVVNIGDNVFKNVKNLTIYSDNPVAIAYANKYNINISKQ